jgi:cellulose synthase/poly-beta-1,6-N-acetylglucosamine synthase-like glycosyltransferase
VMALLTVYPLSTVLIAVIAWCYSLYYLFLAVFRLQNNSCDEIMTAEKPHFHIIIPCFQEEQSILAKLVNTSNLDYPTDSYDVTVVDGGSTDNTPQLAREFCKSRQNFHFVSSPKKGKIPQLNFVLEKIRNGVVAVTDVDGEVAPDALNRLAQLYGDPQVGCIGAFVVPSNPSPEDELFWQYQNEMRLMESSLGHVSVMIAAFYSFRRELFHLFPEDVIADDVFVAFCSNTQGCISLYKREIRAFESRSGSTSIQMLRHKLRKVNANMKELARFCPRLPEMKGLWRVMYVTKFAQHWLVAPSFVILAVLFVVSVVRDGFGAMVFWIFSLLIVTFLQGLTQRTLSRFIIAGGIKVSSVSMAQRISYLMIFHLVLIAGFFRYLLVRQSSVYNKVS